MEMREAALTHLPKHKISKYSLKKRLQSKRQQVASESAHKFTQYKDNQRLSIVNASASRLAIPVQGSDHEALACIIQAQRFDLIDSISLPASEALCGSAVLRSVG